MEYEIKINDNIPNESDFDLLHDNPYSVKQTIEKLKEAYPKISYDIFKDGKKLTMKQFRKCLDICDLQQDAQETPLTARTGWDSNNDISISSEGPKIVWKPPNPEDDYR